MDDRWRKLGDLLVNYSLEVKKGEKVLIVMEEVNSYPAACGTYEAVIKAGAYPQIVFRSEKLNHILTKFGSAEQIEWVPEMESYGMEWADVYIGLRGAANPSECWDVSASALSKLRQTLGKLSSLRWQKTRWCLVRIPYVTLAQQGGIDEDALEEMFFGACFLDWPQISKKWNDCARILGKGKHVRILGKKTDLSFSIEGRKWSVDDGHINMPGGEISTAPVENTVEGYIYFDSPAVFGGKIIHDITLCWKMGKLVEVTASKNEDFLKAVLNTDPGASRIGEFAIGTNPGLKYMCGDILLDEKISGTIHIAMGRAYPDVGGTNQSAIHWDIIKDLRDEGEIYLDGELIFKNGQLLI